MTDKDGQLLEKEAKDYEYIREWREKYMSESFEEEGFKHYDTFTCENGEVVDVWMKRLGLNGCMATEIRRATSEDGGVRCFVFAHGIPLTSREIRAAEALPEMVKWDKPFCTGSLWEAVGVACIIERRLFHSTAFERVALEYVLARLQAHVEEGK